MHQEAGGQPPKNKNKKKKKKKEEEEEEEAAARWKVTTVGFRQRFIKPFSAFAQPLDHLWFFWTSFKALHTSNMPRRGKRSQAQIDRRRKPNASELPDKPVDVPPCSHSVLNKVLVSTTTEICADGAPVPQIGQAVETLPSTAQYAAPSEVLVSTTTTLCADGAPVPKIGKATETLPSTDQHAAPSEVCFIAI
ncbi:uncharacterized protein LOC127530896 isoform X3 [Acanthochromis polyacanthus]|uniref:uncharacterized protein LOC127530896 isoform X2 n=1 Tax=Acanthochromis polyacanthus TaxID=80966 RepID=UPI002233FB96|nr:uncharacterized protein LOC127530896 isoform X2 [Acanthochromis polyacanthus]XP_051794683.1 uncharacterized protein LOC127530896 isoform X3 [Acanthochromis polyacanthus]